MKPFTLTTLLLLSACSVGLTPYGEEQPIGFEAEDNTRQQISVQWGEQSFRHNDTAFIEYAASAGEETALIHLTVLNESSEDLELQGSPTLRLWLNEGQQFGIIEQPESFLPAGGTFTFTLVVPVQNALSNSQLQFRWGDGEDQAFGLDIEVTQRIDGGLVQTDERIEKATDPAIEDESEENEENTAVAERFIVAGKDGVIAVSDATGEHWETSWPGDGNPLFHRPNDDVNEWDALINTQSRVVLFGTNVLGKAIAWESQDGFHWSETPLKEFRGQRPKAGVTLDSGMEVFVGRTAFFVSQPGDSTIALSYTLDESGDDKTALSSLATDGTQLIATKQDDQWLSSTNGVDWTFSGLRLENNHLQDILYRDGRFISVGTNHRATVSTDGGETWRGAETTRDGLTQFNGDCERPDSWCHIRWDGVEFVVYERGRTDVGPAIRWSSDDGLIWMGEETSVPRAPMANGEPSAHYGFSRWDTSKSNGNVVSIEYIHRYVKQGAVPQLYRSTDGIEFEPILENLSGAPILSLITAFQPVVD